MSNQPDVESHAPPARVLGASLELQGREERAVHTSAASDSEPSLGLADEENLGTNDASADEEASYAASEHTLQAWRVLIGSLCMTIATYGLMSSIGLFQTYWQGHQLANESPTKISWILSIFGFLDCFFCVAAGCIFDRFELWHYLPFTSLAYVAAFLGLGWASTYAEFLGCFVVAGVFAAFPSTVAFGVVDHWFRKHHAFAMGFVTLGAPVGGIFFSLVLQALFDRLDWKTAMVVLACILFGLLVTGNALVETRLTKCTATAPADSGLLSGWFRGWSLLRSRKFFLFSWCVFVFEFVLFAQWGSLPAYAVFLGLGNQFYVQMTYNIGAIFARTLPPFLATRWGPFNVTLFMIAFTMFVMFAIWIPVGDRSAAALYVVAFLVGSGTGAFTPLAASCISELCDRRGYGKWIGAAYTLGSFATLISSPATQLILQSKGPRTLVAILGVVLFTALCTCSAARWLKLGGRWAWTARV